MKYRLFILLLLLAPAAYAQDAGLAVLRLGVNAEAMALGDAQVAASRDAFSTYWNPAGLAAATDNSVGLSHRIWIADTRTYAAAARFRAGARGGVGLFVTATGSGDLEEREQPGDPLGFFEVQEFSSGAAYGRQVGPVRAGLTAKYLSQRIFGHAATGYAFDAGLQYDMPQDLGTVGVALQHVGRMTDLVDEETPLPRTLRAGVSVTPLRVRARDDDALIGAATLNAEVSHVFPNDATQWHFGLGAEVLDLIALRVGYITDDALRDLTFGAGLRYQTIRFNYAFLPFENGFGGPGHVLTLSYGW